MLQEVSVKRDRAGLAHFFIFWGFLSFAARYILFIFGDSIWGDLSSTVLTETGVRVFASYLDILAVGFFAVLAWAHLRGLPANSPASTGASGRRVLGSLTPGGA